MKARVIGAGLAGCEAAYQLAKRGIAVELVEMKPSKRTPAHVSDGFAELVCSNSLRSNDPLNAVGLLKQEMRLLDSLILRCADACAVPAGGALAVDRNRFSAMATEAMRSNPLIEVVEEEATLLERDCLTIVATGPLTGGALAESIRALLGEEYLHFFDAAAPIVTGESIDDSCAFRSDRYGDGEAGGDYVNCPLDQEQYLAFWNALSTAQTVQLHGFENNRVFEGCMPIEVMAARGKDTMRFGPLKPVGLTDPVTGRRPYAAVQLRAEDTAGSLYNLVGFQTHLTFPEQRRVFSMIPALASAEFVRYGVMHRNTFLNSPRLLNCHYQLKREPNLFFAGQMTGVEGYVESASSGLVAGICAARYAKGLPMPDFTRKTATGALQHHVAGSVSADFQPMNVNFGIMEEPEERIRDKRARREAMSARALQKIKEMGNFL